LKKISPWSPETNQVRLAVLGKLLEELGEGTQMASRCIIQGIDESEPITGKVNRLAFQNELADIFACMEIAVDYFDLDFNSMNQRITDTVAGFKLWHSMIEKGLDEST